jgi:hypothetical protein
MFRISVLIFVQIPMVMEDLRERAHLKDLVQWWFLSVLFMLHNHQEAW